MRLERTIKIGITTLLALAIAGFMSSSAFADSHEGLAAEAQGMGDAMKKSGEDTAEAAKRKGKDKASSETERATKKAEKEKAKAEKSMDKGIAKGNEEADAAVKKIDGLTAPE